MRRARRRRALRDRAGGRSPWSIRQQGHRLRGVQVRCLPDIEPARVGRQNAVIDVRVVHRRQRFDTHQPVAPRPGRRRVAHAVVGRLVVVARYLRGEYAAGRHQGHGPGEQRVMPGQPLQRGVGDHHVGRCLGRPIGDVGLDPADIGQKTARHRKHSGGVVDPGDPRARPAFGQQPGHPAVAATEVVDGGRGLHRQARQQVRDGAHAFGRELAVLGRVPVLDTAARAPALIRRRSARRRPGGPRTSTR